MKRMLRPVSYVLAAIYFCVDFVFAGIARPISKWIARHFEMRPVRDWICSLPPYPCLALFSLPVICLSRSNLLRPIWQRPATFFTPSRLLS